MSIKPPPRFVVHTAHTHAGARRRRVWLVAGWMGSLLVVATLVYLLAGHGPLRVGAVATDQPLRHENDQLKQQLATLRQARTVDAVATKRLRDALADRDEEISGLRADLAFYSRLVGGSQRDGLQLQGVHLARVTQAPHAWNLTLTLTQNVRNRREIKGAISVAVEGIRNQTVQRLDWTQLAGKHAGDGLDYRFKYFQQLHGTLVLPAGFTPNRLLISVSPARGKDFTRTVAWADAQKQTEITDVQQQ